MPTGPRPRADDAGVGLVEVIIAFAILLIVLVPVSYLLTNALQSSGQARNKVAALAVAEKWVEALNNSGPDPTHETTPTVGTVGVPIHEPRTTSRSLVTTPTTGHQLTAHYTTTDGTKYFATGYFSWAAPTPRKPAGKQPDVCSSGTAPDNLRLTVTVRWGPANGDVEEVTTITDWPPSGIPKDGFIAVQIQRSPTDPTDLGVPESAQSTPWGGGEDTRVREVPITVAPATTPSDVAPTTVYPSTNGCAFVQRPPGAYKVTAGPKTLSTPLVKAGSTTYSQAYADPDGAVTVAVDQVSKVDLLYDEGAYVSVGYPDPTTTDGLLACSTAGQLCVASGQSPSGTASNGSTGIVATTSVLSGTSWSSVHPLSSTGMSQIESMACSTGLCVAVGNGPGGGSTVTHDTAQAATAWVSVPDPPGSTIKNLTQVHCPGSTVCLAIGSGRTGPVLLVGKITGKVLSWSRTTALPTGLTALAQFTCPAATACVAIGSAGASPVLVTGRVAGTGSWTWSTTAPPGATSLAQLACPSTSVCVATGTVSGSAGDVTGSAAVTGGWTWSTATPLPSGTSAITALTCPTATSCVATGTVSGSAAILSGTAAGGKWSWSTTRPGNITSLTKVTCPNAGVCLAIGSTATGAAIVAGAPSGTWVSDTAAGASSLSRITCPGTATCLATGTASGKAVIVSGPASTGVHGWTSASLPSVVGSADFLAGLGCFKSTTLVCGAAGADASGAMLLDDTSAQSSTTWAVATAGAASGVVAGGLPVSVSSTTFTNASFVACTSASTVADSCTTIGPLFPYTGGYSVGVASCTGELDHGALHATSTPGTTTALATHLVLPLGVIDLDLVNASGQPVAGAPASATVSDPSHHGCTGTYTLGNTNNDGQVGIAVMEETYSVTVGTVTELLAVTATSVAVLTATTRAVLATYPLPSPVVVVT